VNTQTGAGAGAMQRVLSRMWCGRVSGRDASPAGEPQPSALHFATTAQPILQQVNSSNTCNTITKA